MPLLLVPYSSAAFAITLDAKTGGHTSGVSLTISHTIGAGNNRALVVSIDTQDSNHASLPITSVTYGGMALTQVNNVSAPVSTNCHTEQWILLNPPVGTANIVINVAGACFIGAENTSWFGVDQANQPNALATGTGRGSNPSTSITTLNPNCMVIDVVGSEDVYSAVGGSQTIIGSQQGQAFENIVATYKQQATAAATTMSETIGANNNWAQSVLALAPVGTSTGAPTVSTTSVTSVGQNGATFTGNITNDGGANIIERGFQYGTTQTPIDRVINATGSNLGSGSYNFSPTALTPGTQYFVRAYAINNQGTGYGAWIGFLTLPAIYKITIAGVDRTADIINKSITVTDQVTVQQNTMSFQMIDRRNLGVPTTDQEIIVTLDTGVKLFGGYTVKRQVQQLKGGMVLYQFDCVDYARLLDRNLVNKTYLNQTDSFIINDIVNTYCPGFGITTTNVISGVTLDQISFNYVQPSQAIRKICDLTGRNWYIDYNKDIHYFPLTQAAAPFNISDSQTYASGQGYFNFSDTSDATQLKNRVYVRGGTQLSNPTSYSTKGDSSKRKFTLPDKPHTVTITVNGVAKTIGIKNIDTSGFDYYLNFEEKYVEQDSGATILSSTDVLAVNYTYDIPILVAVENTASILANGEHEFAIFDSTISTTIAARARAAAELTDYANNLIEAQFDTYTAGFRSGQFVVINSAILGITNTTHFVQKVEAKDLGGGLYVYTVYLATAKTMGIIRFLIELLEQANNTVKVSSNEVLDNLLTLNDSIDPSSLTEALTIDSAGAYATWCTDSLQATPTTRARWNLFQWG